MSAIIGMILDQLLPYVYVAGAALVAGILYWVRRSGAKAEVAKQDKRDKKATEERLEMHREANATEIAARDLTDEQAKREALSWSKRQP